MEITTHTSPQDRQIYFVKGLIKQKALDKINQVLAEAPGSSSKELWIDCSHVDRLHLTNSSICSFVSELLKIRKYNVKVVLCDMNPTTERLFRLLRLDSLFEKSTSEHYSRLQGKVDLIAA